jgi:hypothetical protein
MPEWFRPILFTKIAIGLLVGSAILGGICTQAFGSAGKFRFFKGMWAGVLVFISVVMVVVIVAAVLIYAHVIYPEYWR